MAETPEEAATVNDSLIQADRHEQENAEPGAAAGEPNQPAHRYLLDEDQDDEDGAVFAAAAPEDQPQAEHEDQGEFNQQTEIVRINPNFLEEAMLMLHTRVCIVLLICLKPQVRKCFLMTLGMATVLVGLVFACLHGSFVRRCSGSHVLGDVLASVGPRGNLVTGWPDLNATTGSGSMLIVAIELIGDQLPRIDGVYQPIMTRMILPNMTNANQTAEEWSTVLDKSDAMFSADQDSLVALPCLMRFPTRTRWCNATAAENYVLIQAKVDKWSILFGYFPVAFVVNSILGPDLVLYNSASCIANDLSTSVSLRQAGTAAKSQVQTFEPRTDSWVTTIGTAINRMATVMASFAILSMVSSFKVWVYGVYMVPAVAVGAQRFCTLGGQQELHVERMAPWCTQPRFLLYACGSALLAWTVFPGVALSLVTKWFVSVSDFPGYVYGLVLFSEGFFMVVARSEATIRIFPQVVVATYILTTLYAMCFGAIGAWPLAIFLAHLVVLGTALSLFFFHEFAVYEQLSSTKPRQYRYTAVIGAKYGELPKFWEIYQDGPWYVNHDHLGGLHLVKRGRDGNLPEFAQNRR